MLNIRYTRNGALRFLRIGRFQFSFCLCSAEKTAALFKSIWTMPPILDLHDYRLATPRQYYDSMR
jgi:hypothetical protein